MTTHNANNERIKRRYFAFLKEAKRHSVSTVDAVAKAIDRFESYTKRRDFKAFHYEQAVAFKNHLADHPSPHTGEQLSKATLHATLASLKTFFQWLTEQPGYRSRLRYSEADYFNLSDKDTRVAKARREQLAPTLEQVKHVIATMAADTEIERRNRALIACAILTGARDSAMASMRLKHVDLVAGSVYQDAREVRTKFSKTFTTFFFRVGEDIQSVMADWVTYLREVKLWGNDDPLFPATHIAVGAARQFEVAGLERAHWSSAAPIRAVFRKAFVSAGLPYFNPHSFRNTLVRLGEEVCQTPEEFKAWSQNLGHEGVLTTFYSYGVVGNRRQGEIIRSLATARYATPQNVTELAKALLREFRDAGTTMPSSLS